MKCDIQKQAPNDNLMLISTYSINELKVVQVIHQKCSSIVLFRPHCSAKAKLCLKATLPKLVSVISLKSKLTHFIVL